MNPELRALSCQRRRVRCGVRLGGPRNIGVPGLAPQTLVLNYTDFADSRIPRITAFQGICPIAVQSWIAERAAFLGERPHHPGIISGEPEFLGELPQHRSLTCRGSQPFFRELPHHPTAIAEQQAVAVPQKEQDERLREAEEHQRNPLIRQIPVVPTAGLWGQPSHEKAAPSTERMAQAVGPPRGPRSPQKKRGVTSMATPRSTILSHSGGGARTHDRAINSRLLYH